MLDSGRFGPAVRRCLAVALSIPVAGLVACGGGGDDDSAPTAVPQDAVAVVAEAPIGKDSFERRFRAAASGLPSFFGNSASGTVLDAPKFKRCIVRLRKETLSAMKAAGAGSASRPTAKQLKENCKLQHDQLRLRTLSQMITEEWHRQAVADTDIDLGDEAIATRLAQYEKSVAGGRAKFKALVKRSGLTAEDLAAQLRGELARQAWEAGHNQPPELSDDDIERYYEEHPGRFGQAATRTVEIVAVDDEDAAKEALGRVEKGEGVAAVSSEVSTDFNVRGSDGVLEVAQGESTLPDGLETEVFEADRDAVTGPIQVDGTWYVFKVVGSTEAKVPPFAKVEDLARELATAVAAQRATAEATNAFREEWRGRTLCADGYLVAECSNGPELEPVPVP